MKKIILLVALALTVSLPQVHAQTQATKFGYVNSQELLTLMPEAAQADSSLAKYMRTLDQQYAMMAKEGREKLQEYQAQKANWTPAVRETKERAITDLQSRMQEFQVSAQDSIQAKRKALFEPLLDKAQKAIKAVGKEGGYDFIFDGSALLYAKDSKNLMPEVKAKLGIK